MATLTAAERAKLPASDFVYPQTREYPIHDLAHARAALRFSAGTQAESRVRSAVRRRWGIS